MAFYSLHLLAQIRSDNFGFIIITSGVLSVEGLIFKLDLSAFLQICVYQIGRNVGQWDGVCPILPV